MLSATGSNLGCSLYRDIVLGQLMASALNHVFGDGDFTALSINDGSAEHDLLGLRLSAASLVVAVDSGL